MIPRRYQSLLFAFFMALFMSFLMSLVITVFNIGLPPEFFERWMHAWLFAFVIAFPLVIIFAPTVRKLVSWLTQQPNAS